MMFKHVLCIQIYPQLKAERCIGNTRKCPMRNSQEPKRKLQTPNTFNRQRVYIQFQARFAFSHVIQRTNIPFCNEYIVVNVFCLFVSMIFNEGGYLT